MTAQIQLHDVCYTYPNRDFRALDNVGIIVSPGQFLLVAGPSGSGKSTVLRTINGLVPHFSGGVISGDVIVKGMDVIRFGPSILSQSVGFVSQNPEAQSLLETVEPEIAFALENAAVPRPEMQRRVSEVLDLLNLTELRHRSLVTLSGGERQRVAIACALALKPDILVLDEPTSQLDPDSADEVLRSLVALNHDLGLTIILAEHRLERVLPYIDAIAYFEQGRILEHNVVRQVLPRIAQPPPLIELARKLEWHPLPLTMEAAKRKADAIYSQQDERPLTSTDAANPDIEPLDRLLHTQGISFAYNGGNPVLREINLEVRAGEILAILGQNGSGKSTLLKCLIGLLKPIQGDIVLHGRSILGRETSDLAKEIAYLPQYPDDLLFADTVSGELEITLKNHDLPVGDRVEMMLADLDLLAEAHSYPRDLSTGQRQRVALGAVMITQPVILLLDEPTRGLDGRLKRQLGAKWQEWRSLGMGIVLATHDVELAALVADRVLILEDGQQADYGTAADVLGRLTAFTPQIARLFRASGWLTVDEVLDGLASTREDLP